ncbi:hypothetical protein SFRURICE_010932 [Spodoptera frugiperda]|nr:hypothetical protein SFRURICE_010932 [Spodoptera frugiperda]
MRHKWMCKFKRTSLERMVVPKTQLKVSGSTGVIPRRHRKSTKPTTLQRNVNSTLFPSDLKHETSKYIVKGTTDAFSSHTLHEAQMSPALSLVDLESNLDAQSQWLRYH